MSRSSGTHAASELSPVYYCAACAYNVFLSILFPLPFFFFLFLFSYVVSFPSIRLVSPSPSFIFFSLSLSCSLFPLARSLSTGERASERASTSQAKWRRSRVYRETHYASVYFYQRKCVVVRARIPAQPAPGKATPKVEEGAWNAPRVTHTYIRTHVHSCVPAIVAATRAFPPKVHPLSSSLP